MKSINRLCLVLILLLTVGGCERESARSSEPAEGVVITNISVPDTCVQGETVPVVVSLENRGDQQQTFEISLTDTTDGREIGKRSVTLSASNTGGMDEICDIILDPPMDGGGEFGEFMDYGDVNGDGYNDLLIAALMWNNETGRTYLYYGGPNMDTYPDKIFEGEDAGDRFGQDVCLGDVNGDGFDDVILGTVWHNNLRGRVYIFYGGPDMDLKCDLIIDGEKGTSGRFGRIMDVADMDNDGYEDLLVAAPLSDTQVWEGRVYLYYGGNSIDTNTVKVFKGENDKDSFGLKSVMGKDVDGDGYRDILIGAVGYPSFNPDQGRAYLYYGNDRTNLDTDCDVIFTCPEHSRNHFGYVNMFDINSDGFADILIGARTWPGDDTFQGRVYLYWGSSRMTMDNVADLVFTGEADAQATLGGNTVYAGYVDGDKYGDILVGAFNYYKISLKGCAYVFYGGTKESMDGVYDQVFKEDVPGTSVFGKDAILCDLDSDGFDEAIISAYGYNNSQGRVFIYWNKPPSSTEVPFNWDTAKTFPGDHILEVSVRDKDRLVGNTKRITVGLGPTLLSKKEGSLKEQSQISVTSTKTVTPSLKNPTGSLTVAAVDGDIEQVKSHLAWGTDINEKTISGDTALHYAIKYRHRAVAELLITNGVGINDRNRDGETPAHLAIKTNQSEILDLLTKKGAGVSPVHLVAYKGDLAAVRKFVEGKTPVNAADEGGLTLLHAAASGGQKEVAEYLIGQGAQVNVYDKKRQTPLFCAAASDHREAVRLLLARGAEPNPSRDPDYWTPLYAAVDAGHRDVVELLADKGGNVNAKAITGDTPLHVAALKGDIDMVELLILKGVNLNATNARYGNTPLHLAIAGGHRDIVQLLMAKGADLNVKNREDENTPLHQAVVAGHRDIVDLLATKRENLDIKNKDGFAPIHYAVSPRRLSWWESRIGESSTPSDLAITELLITHGADVNMKSDNGATPLSLAKRGSKAEIVELLRKHGAKE